MGYYTSFVSGLDTFVGAERKIMTESTDTLPRAASPGAPATGALWKDLPAGNDPGAFITALGGLAALGRRQLRAF
jgi:hypothetical protein